MTSQPAPTPPRAPQEPYVRSFHGDDVSDPFHWMSDKTDPRLLAYLDAENAYTEAVTADQASLRAEIFDDIATRTLQTDLSAPLFVTHVGGDAYWYYARTTEGDDYERHCRVPATSRDQVPEVTVPRADEEIILDVQALAQGHDFFAMGWSEVSPSGRLLAYSVDVAGDERYDLVVVELATGAIVDGPIRGVGAGGAWLGDEWLFYLRIDEAWRPHEVWRRRLGTTDDSLVIREDDERFWVGVDGSRDYGHVLIEMASTTSSEAHLVPCSNPTAPPRCIAPREDGIEYDVEVTPDTLYIIHNADHRQFSLASAPVDASSRADWTSLLPGRDDRRLTGVLAYADALVVTHRTDGQAGVGVLAREGDGWSALREIEFDEDLYDVDAAADPDYRSDRVRLTFESLATPRRLIEYTLTTGEQRVLKETPVLPHPRHGEYAASDYISERLWATADDGTRVPISLVRRRDTPRDGSAPAVLYGYGAYEVSMAPFFSIGRLSLLDRGFVYAIAHVRGGGELGRPWYEQGKLAAKPNTFTDFIACARALVDAGYTRPERLVAEGGSAGGLLMGAVATMAPDAFVGVHAAVPFVDALTTTLNPELPLTITEWEEWGDPLHDPAVYALMKEYSPYDAVRAQRYPALLVTTSLNDTRVEVTEPAKWVAKLRETALNTPAEPICLRTQMVAGHAGVSGRYEAWRDRAFELAWIITTATRH